MQKDNSIAFLESKIKEISEWSPEKIQEIQKEYQKYLVEESKAKEKEEGYFEFVPPSKE